MSKRQSSRGKSKASLHDLQPKPYSIQAVKAIVKKFGKSNVFIVTSGSKDDEEQVLKWLTATQFLEKTGMVADRGHVFVVDERQKAKQVREIVERLVLTCYIESDRGLAEEISPKLQGEVFLWGVEDLNLPVKAPIASNKSKGGKQDTTKQEHKEPAPKVVSDDGKIKAVKDWREVMKGMMLSELDLVDWQASQQASKPTKTTAMAAPVVTSPPKYANGKWEAGADMFGANPVQLNAPLRSSS